MDEPKELLEMLLLAAWEESDIWIAEMELNTELFSDLTPAQKRATAISTIQRLLALRRISLHRYQWPRGDWQIIDPQDYERILSDPTSWEPPDDDGGWAYGIHSTERGEKEL